MTTSKFKITHDLTPGYCFIFTDWKIIKKSTLDLMKSQNFKFGEKRGQKSVEKNRTKKKERKRLITRVNSPLIAVHQVNSTTQNISTGLVEEVTSSHTHSHSHTCCPAKGPSRSRIVSVPLSLA